MNRRRICIGLVVVAASGLACRGSSADTPSSSTTAALGSTDSVGLTASSDSVGTDRSAGTTAYPSTTGSTETAMETGITTAADADGGTTTDTPGPQGKPCSLMAIDPTTDPATVIDAGDLPGQLPTVIGDALLRNCGCHYTDNVVGYTDYLSNATPMSTHADFHTNFAGVFPMGFEDRLTWEACEVRAVFGRPVPMPPNECGVEGELGNISNADFVLFARWFEAGAPDGANFP